MLKQYLIGYQRKKIVLICLFTCSILALGLGSIFGRSELSLPYDTQLDELRLLDPNQVTENSSSRVASMAFESELASYNNCRTQSVNLCSKIIETMLHSKPSDGRLWLEYSRSLTKENGLDAKALTALNNSFIFAPLENWMLEARSSFALSVWPGLSKDIQDKAAKEIINGLSSFKYASYVAQLYVDRLLMRKTIASLLEMAPVADQKRVLGLINAKSKT